MKNRRKVIQYSDPGKILALVMNLTGDKGTDLQINVNTYLAEECEAEFVFIIIVHAERNEAFIEAVGNTALPVERMLKITPKIETALKNSCETTDILNNFDAEILDIVQPFLAKDNVKNKKITMLPVIDKSFQALFCVVAPKVEENTVANLIHECALFTFPILKKTVALEYECILKKKCQTLLRVARNLFSQVASLDTLLPLTMRLAKELTKAAHCNVMLIDVERNELYEPCKQGAQEGRRFPLNVGIAGEVVKTGKLINMQHGSVHPAFDPNVDSLPDVDCKNMLCFPIREQAGIIGVLQLINKKGGPYFDGMDEEMALSFSIYCGVCIIHSVIYQKIQEAHIRMALANELVMYHMKVSPVEVQRLLECTGFHGNPHLNSLHFNFRALPLRELPCYAVKMFCDLGFDKRFKIQKYKLVSLVLQTKKGYRDVPYHNWLHAFNVLQWAYAAIINFKLMSGYFTDLQGLMFLIASMMHDLDHRGTTNSFHIQGQTTLAALYSSEGSVMERHHLSQAMSILNTEGCDVLETLPRRDYDKALLLLRDFILATDLSNFFKNKSDYTAISVDFQKGNKLHISALSALLMNCADLNDQIKDWANVKKSAASVLTEFFKQGEEEKSRGALPSLMIDKDKCCIPDLQIQFINFVCIPLYELISTMLPKASPCIKILENHIERWDASKPVFAEVPANAGLSVLLSPELDTLIEINLREKELERERLAQAAENPVPEEEED